MGSTIGEYAFGPETGRLVLEAARAGAAARAGHDLLIEVTRWHGEAVIDTADPAACAVSVTADAGSLAVRRGSGGVKPLTDGDRAEIERTIRERILQAARHPQITFRSARVTGTPGSFRATGPLTIMGVTRDVEVTGSLSGGRAHGTAVVTQSRWGIRPYSAFLGALRVADDVVVRFDVELVPRR